MDQRVPAQSLQETPCTARGWRRHAGCWWCSDHQNRRQEQREVAAGNHQEFDRWKWQSRWRSKIARRKVLRGTCDPTTLPIGTIVWQADDSIPGGDEPRGCSISPKTGCCSCSTVRLQEIPKRKSEMNSPNEQCYQLAFSWRTDTIETVVLFTFKKWLSIWWVWTFYSKQSNLSEKHI